MSKVLSPLRFVEEDTMRKVIVGGANSLDNYIARKDDSVDWLLWSKELTPIMK